MRGVVVYSFDTLPDASGNLAAAVHLVDAGADCKWKDDVGRSLAFFCVQHLVCIKFLHQNGVDIAEPDAQVAIDSLTFLGTFVVVCDPRHLSRLILVIDSLYRLSFPPPAHLLPPRRCGGGQHRRDGLPHQPHEGGSLRGRH